MSHTQNSGHNSKLSEFRAPMPPPSTLSAGNLISSIRASKFSNDSSNSLSKNGSQTQVRKSKFSDKPPGVVPPPGVITTPAPKVDAVAAAAAAAAKINANLRAKGKLSDQTLLKPVGNSGSALSLIKISETKKVFSSYIAKIDINDLPPNIRTYFTQVSVQEAINKETGVAMSTKGQFLTPEEKKTLEGIEKQLHLYIQSPSQEKTDMAVAKIKDMISKQKLPGISNALSKSNQLILPPVRPIPPGQPTLPTGNFVQEKVFVGMDYCVPEFDLRTKLIGINYTNFNFVANATGAKVILRGKGSGFIEPTSGREAFESMYVFISHPNQAGVDAAKKLVYNLISTVHSEYNNFRTKKSNSPTTSFSAPTTTFPQYPPTLPVGVSPYGTVNMQNVSSVNSYTNPYAAPCPPVANLYSNQPTGSVYSAAPPVANPYNATNQAAVGFVPALTTANQNACTFNTPTDSQNKDIKTSVSTSSNFEAKVKKRRFQEEQPDDSNLLGYKQFSAQVEDEQTKRLKKSNVLSADEPTKYYEENQTANLPFWMSHD